MGIGHLPLVANACWPELPGVPLLPLEVAARDVDLAVAAAKRAGPGYAETTREQRIELLEAILAEFAKRHDEIAEAIMDEMGAPWGLAKGAQAGSGPQHIKAAAKQAGAVAQFAGGTPAMCDGVTQGQDGMDLSLFSRDVIALSTAVALSHNMFDAAVCLGICDKIVPGLMIGALSFGHLPVVFVPAGPMVSGLSNKEKAHVRELYAAGKVGRDELLAAGEKSVLEMVASNAALTECSNRWASVST